MCSKFVMYYGNYEVCACAVFVMYCVNFGVSTCACAVCVMYCGNYGVSACAVSVSCTVESMVYLLVR